MHKLSDKFVDMKFIIVSEDMCLLLCPIVESEEYLIVIGDNCELNNIVNIEY